MDDLPNSTDRLLRKYIHVWLWSILFGAASGLAYTFIGVRVSRPWGALGMPIIVLITVGGFATLGARK